MIAKFVPMFFNSLTIEQMQRIEYRAIHTNNYTMRTNLRKASHGDTIAQREVMEVVSKDPTWIEKKSE
jgi:hypothetical protein